MNISTFFEYMCKNLLCGNQFRKHQFSMKIKITFNKTETAENPTVSMNSMNNASTICHLLNAYMI